MSTDADNGCDLSNANKRGNFAALNVSIIAEMYSKMKIVGTRPILSRRLLVPQAENLV